MKKSLIVLILLSALLGCDKSPAPIRVQNERNNSLTPEPAGSHEATDIGSTAAYLTSVLGKSSLEAITTEPEQTDKPNSTDTFQKTVVSDRTVKPKVTTETKQADQPEKTAPVVPIKYFSRKDGFRVLMPSDPTVMNLDAASNAHVRLYQTQTHEGLIQYNVFFHFFDKKIFKDEFVQSYLDSTLPDRLVGVEKGQIYQKILTKFKGFDAKKFEYISAEGDAEFIYKGIVFLIDGDSVSLTMMYPKEDPPDLSFDEFTESFELLPLEPRLSPNEWIDERLGLRFTPPAEMFNLKRETGRNGLVVLFANDAGHSIGILDATVAYPDITWSDIEKNLSEMKDCGEGFYEKIIPGTKTKPPTVQLLRCIHNGERIFLAQAYAPQKTYFRSVRTLKASLKSLRLDDR